MLTKCFKDKGKFFLIDRLMLFHAIELWIGSRSARTWCGGGCWRGRAWGVVGSDQ